MAKETAIARLLGTFSPRPPDADWMEVMVRGEPFRLTLTQQAKDQAARCLVGSLVRVVAGLRQITWRTADRVVHRRIELVAKTVVMLKAPRRRVLV